MDMKIIDEIPSEILAIQADPPSLLVSFHGSQLVKDFYTARLKKHHVADEIVKGYYWDSGKGCAIGCLLHSGQHDIGEKELGLPTWLLRLVDLIFENLPNEEAKNFALQFIETIPVGISLEPVRHRVCSFLMEENLTSMELLNIASELKTKIKTVILQVKTLHDSESKSESEWTAARTAARSAELMALKDRSGTLAAFAAEAATCSASTWSVSAIAEYAVWTILATARLVEWLNIKSMYWASRWLVMDPTTVAEMRSATYRRYARTLLELLAAAK